MPQISKFYGIIIYMYINEHNPPHFHVEYQGYKASITIESGIVIGVYAAPGTEFGVRMARLAQRRTDEQLGTPLQSGSSLKY